MDVVDRIGIVVDALVLTRPRGPKRPSGTGRPGVILDGMTDETSTATATPTAAAPTRVPPPTVWPTLRSHDAHALIAFLVTAFGFIEVFRAEEGERVEHAQLAWPDGGGVMLGSVRQGDDGWALTPGSAGMYVVCRSAEEVDALHERAVAAGAQLHKPVQDTDYGSHEVAFRDVDGNLWDFGTYPGEPRPA